ncbi:MAG: hypothetical protein V4654_15590 [Bdellovibrionota bacterium]
MRWMIVSLFIFSLTSLDANSQNLEKIIAVQEAQIHQLKMMGVWSKELAFSLDTAGFAIGNGISSQRYRVVGDNLEVSFYITGGTTTKWGDGPVKFNLPPGFKVNSDKLLKTPWDLRFRCGEALAFRNDISKKSMGSPAWHSQLDSMTILFAESLTNTFTTMSELNLGTAASQLSGHYCLPVMVK